MASKNATPAVAKATKSKKSAIAPVAAPVAAVAVKIKTKLDSMTAAQKKALFDKVHNAQELRLAVSTSRMYSTLHAFIKEKGYTELSDVAASKENGYYFVTCSNIAEGRYRNIFFSKGLTAQYNGTVIPISQLYHYPVHGVMALDENGVEKKDGERLILGRIPTSTAGKYNAVPMDVESIDGRFVSINDDENEG